ncbi:MAG TPA: PsiF family protein [Steroidobacteraceae bacterium]|nr:PsiF family protein [Steroidobacteraceae bacterium]
MKMTSALVAVVLLGSGAAFAADTPAAAPATTAPSATPVAKHASLKACNKQADEKKLTGKDRSSFVKDCRAGKSSGG